MIRVLIEKSDTIHPYKVYYKAFLLKEAPDAWLLWHWWFHIIPEWVPKNSMDEQVKKQI